VVAEGRGGGMLAAAPFHQPPLVNGNNHGQEGGPDMRIIAERLVLAQPTGTPQVGPWFCFDLNGPESGDIWSGIIFHFDNVIPVRYNLAWAVT
jgi:hypothetical protein